MIWLWAAIAAIAVAGFIINRRQQTVIAELARLASLVDTENKPAPARTRRGGEPSDSKGVKPNESASKARGRLQVKGGHRR